MLLLLLLQLAKISSNLIELLAIRYAILRCVVWWSSDSIELKLLNRMLYARASYELIESFRRSRQHAQMIDLSCCVKLRHKTHCLSIKIQIEICEYLPSKLTTTRMFYPVRFSRQTLNQLTELTIFNLNNHFVVWASECARIHSFYIYNQSTGG